MGPGVAGMTGGRRWAARLAAGTVVLMVLAGCAGPNAASDARISTAATDDRFSADGAAEARAAAAEARQAGRGRDALMSAALAVDRWPADPRNWDALAVAYADSGRPEGRDYARFFATRLPTLNALHPRSAASGLRAVEAPTTVTDPELRRAYADSARLLARFYDGRYEVARADRAADEAADVWEWEPYLAYPAAVAGSAAILSTFVRFARGSGAANTTR